MRVGGLILSFLFLETYTLEDNEEELIQCVREIKCRLGNMGPLLADSNEAVRCEYISVILHASLYIVKRITEKEITLVEKGIFGLNEIRPIFNQN